MAALGCDGEHHLIVKFDGLVHEHGVIARNRAHVVPARDIGSGQHRDNARRTPHGIEVDAGDAAARGRRAAHCNVQSPSGFAQVINIGGAAGHMAHCGIVPDRYANDAQRRLTGGKI
jgi:hypothetical protein